MKIETESQQINALLAEYNWEKCLVWKYHVSMRHMMLRISPQNDPSNIELRVLYILAYGCRHICGPFDLVNPILTVRETYSAEGDRTYLLKDEVNGFELRSNGGIMAYFGKEEEMYEYFDSKISASDS
jgi:hypothetical protein